MKFEILLVLGLFYFLFVLHGLQALIINIDSKQVPFLSRFLYLFFTGPLVGFFHMLTSPISAYNPMLEKFDRMTMRAKYSKIVRNHETKESDNVINFRKD